MVYLDGLLVWKRKTAGKLGRGMREIMYMLPCCHQVMPELVAELCANAVGDMGLCITRPSNPARIQLATVPGP